MTALKSANAKLLVEQVRAQISKLWTDLHLSDEQKRAYFPAFFAGTYRHPSAAPSLGYGADGR